MYIHMFALRWKPGVSDGQKQRVMAEIRALQGQIPGLLETSVGVGSARTKSALVKIETESTVQWPLASNENSVNWKIEKPPGLAEEARCGPDAS